MLTIHKQKKNINNNINNLELCDHYRLSILKTTFVEQKNIFNSFPSYN